MKLESEQRCTEGMNRSNLIRFLRLMVTLPVMVSMPFIMPLTSIASTDAQAHKYGDALKKANFFYYYQYMGELPDSYPRKNINWRGNSGLNDAMDGETKIDLSGGFYDAGDLIKVTLPLVGTLDTLGWAVLEYRVAFEQAGALQDVKNHIRWGCEWLIKCHPNPNKLYTQVGTPADKVNERWCAVELVDTFNSMPGIENLRKAEYVDNDNHGSAVAGSAAATLAIASKIFEKDDPAFAKTCLDHAKELFAYSIRVNSDEGYNKTDVGASDLYYSGSPGQPSFKDDQAWAAYWLYSATADPVFLTALKKIMKDKSGDHYYDWPGWYSGWCQNWNNKEYGTALLFVRLLLLDPNSSKADKDMGKDLLNTFFKEHITWWINGANCKTPGGLSWLAKWASLRYASNASFVALVFSDITKNPAQREAARNWAKSQIDYVLGDNPRDNGNGGSYIVGYGNNAVKHPHHSTAQGAYSGNQLIPANNRHILYGALAGGPGKDDKYNDDVRDWVGNEVALDYNAGLVGALAKLYGMYGGDPDPKFPPTVAAPPVNDYIFTDAEVKSVENGHLELDCWLNNRYVWPAEARDNLSFRYFADLSSLKDKNSITVDLVHQEGSSASQTRLHWKVWDKSKNIYYVDVSYKGNPLIPGAPQANGGKWTDPKSYIEDLTYCQKKSSLTFHTNEKWDPQKDPSYTGLKVMKKIKTKHIPVYENGELLSGMPPDGKEI